MDNFVYDIGTKIYFGKGQIENLGAAVKAWGDKALLVYGGGSVKRNGAYDAVTASLTEAGIPFAERKSCGKIFRKHIDEPKDLPERIFFTVI